MASIKDILLNIFGGYKGIVLTQISLYNKAKRVAPELSEDDLLNELIISRIKTRLRPAAREQEYIHYEPLLENPHKTLEDVIRAIVEYEVFEVLGVRNVDELEVKSYIEESIEKKVKSPDFKAKKTWKPVAIGVLNIIVGSFTLMGSIMYISQSLLSPIPIPELGRTIAGIPIYDLVMGLLGIASIIGGIFALKRTHWAVAVIGCFCSAGALGGFGWYYLLVFAVLVGILMPSAKREFF
jgi:hypothetical protein